MAIWDWVLRAYGRPGVPEATLKLQDEYGQNTSFLLWAVHAEVKDPERLRRGAEAARAWDALALKPLREVRRVLKPPLAPFEDDARLAFRKDVNGLELQAERLLMETLDAIAGGAAGGAGALEALEAASAAWDRQAPAAALAELAAALG